MSRGMVPGFIASRQGVHRTDANASQRELVAILHLMKKIEIKFIKVNSNIRKMPDCRASRTRLASFMAHSAAC